MSVPFRNNPVRTGLLTLLGTVLLGFAVGACSRTNRTGPAGQPADEPVGPPVFEDATTGSGVDFSYRNGEDAGHFAIIESVGGGLALIDYDRDGALDLFVPGGGRYEGKQVRGHPCKLYRNLGGLKFKDVTAEAGLDLPYPYSHGASAFDFDNDGWADLLVSGYNRLVLLHNQAGPRGRRFVDVTATAGLTDRLWSTSTGWGDLDGDGFPEIYVAHYGDWGFDTNHPTNCTYDGKTRDVCQPAMFKALVHTLYRNNGNGQFTDVSEAIKVKSLGRGLGVLLADTNLDGRPDVYVANDTDDNFLFMNRGKAGKLRLEEVGLLAGVARDEGGRANGSMGVDAGDFDRSGLASIIVTNYETELPALYQNRSVGERASFAFATQPTGLAAVGGQYVSWGTGFVDVDLDGWEDLFIVSGHAVRFPTKIDRRQRPNLLMNSAARFRIATRQGGSYFQEPHNARGTAVGDLDNDGRPDLVVSHLNEPIVILRNVAPTDGRHWIGFELVGKENRDIVGGRVTVESTGGKQTRFVKGGGSFASTNDPRPLFGLGTDATVESVTVHWSWGGSQVFKNLKPDRYWKLVEGEDQPK